MSARALVTGWLAQKVGFPFNESELSPSIRAKIGQVVRLREQVEIKNDGISQRQSEVARLKSQMNSKTAWMIIAIVLGAILLVLIIGAVLLIVAFLLYRQRKKTQTQIQQRVAEMVQLH